LTLIALLAGGTISPAVAQGPWSVFVAGGAAGFGGASQAVPDVEGDVNQFKPAPTTRLHLGVARTFGRAGVAIDGSYAKAGLGAYGGSQTLVIAPAITLYEVRALASYALATLGQSTVLRLSAGPMLQVWSGDAIIDTQTRFGAAAVLAVAVPMTKHLGLIVSGGLSVADSPFLPEGLEGLPVVYEPTAIWTRELAVGLRYCW
jgi:hypothetical protein